MAERAAPVGCDAAQHIDKRVCWFVIEKSGIGYAKGLRRKGRLEPDPQKVIKLCKDPRNSLPAPPASSSLVLLQPTPQWPKAHRYRCRRSIARRRKLPNLTPGLGSRNLASAQSKCRQTSSETLAPAGISARYQPVCSGSKPSSLGAMPNSST